MKFTVCVLFYGNYPELAFRVLSSLSRLQWRGKFVLRVGFNNVEPSLINQLMPFMLEHWPLARVYEGGAPYYKYPLMRGMFEQPPIDTPFTMWFDDDSWVLPEAPDNWFETIEEKMANGFDMLGAIYTQNLKGNQHDWAADQPWYTGKPVEAKHKVTFVTGGWWTARTAIIQKHQWPPPAILHNGGDVMLGELARQQGYRLGNFTTGLAINANESKKCSSSPRRGAHLSPVGVDYRRQTKPVESNPNAWLNFLDGRDL